MDGETISREELTELRALWLGRLRETTGDLDRWGNYDRAWANNFQALHAVSILDEMLSGEEGA